MAPRKPAKREPAKPGPKPKTLSYEQEVQLEALASVLTVEQIADHFGMARSTLFKIMADDPDIRARYDMGKAKAIAEIAGSLLTKARKGDTASQIFFLKTQAGWRETNKVEVSNPDGTLQSKTLDVSRLSTAALKELSGLIEAERDSAVYGDDVK